LLVLLLQLAGCASNSKTLPDWITDTPDTATSIYGVGEGRSVAQAKKNALLEIASKIEVRVQSETSANTTLRNGKLDESFKQQINTRVSEMKLSNFQVEKVEAVAGRYYALAALSRTDFIRNQKGSLERLDKNIDLILSGSQQPHLKKLAAYEEARGVAVQASAIALIITSLDSTFSATPYLEKLERIKRDEKELAGKTYFKVVVARPYQAAKKLMEDALTSNGLQLVGENSPNAVIDIHGESTEKYLFKTYNVRGKIVVQVKTPDAESLGGREHDALGSSFTSADEARNSSLGELFSGMDSRQKVYRFIGLSE